jgi:uncharacterized protein with HEPN domain
MTDSAGLADIVERIDRIQRATAEGREAFTASEVIQDAVVRNLEVIGEAAKAISARTRHQLQAIPWREMARFRDLAIHHYGLVLSEEVWVIVSRDLLRIRRALSRYIATRDAGSEGR